MRLLVPTLLVLATGALGFAQASRPASQPTSRPASQPTSRPAKPTKPKRSPMPPLGHPAGIFGAGVELSKATPLGTVAKKVRELHGRPVRVDGFLKDVCRKKGCWTVLRDGKTEVRVKFRDYSFFVPRDASGRRAIVQGIVSEKTISEAEARHYAEESGKPEEAKKIKGPQKIMAFMATGVEILGKSQLPPQAKAAPGAAESELAGKIAAGAKVPQRRMAPVKTSAQALKLLRRLKGPRTIEFSLYTELKTKGGPWYAFSSTKRGFGAGFAVRSDGTVKSF